VKFVTTGAGWGPLRPISILPGISYTASGRSIHSRPIMFHSSPRGQGLVEYAMLIVLVAITVIVLLALFGSGIGNMFSNIVSNI
jgi:pilus assembly protein Flp/PilA